MAYDYNKKIEELLNLKGQWAYGNQQNNDTIKNYAATKAQQIYQDLRNNGYGNIANELNEADYDGAVKIRNNYAKTGKVSTRDYLSSLGKKYDLTQSQMNDIIKWDNDTGEVSLGGKVIGKPDTVVDGVSYWSDTSVLDDAMKDYIDRTGLTASKSTMVDQMNQELREKYLQEYDDLKNTNPFTTDVGKSILAKYDLAGLQGRDNEAASGAATNGGNIDSFSAANALRQQASLVSQGQETAISAHQQKLDHARNLLSDLGVHIDRVYDQDETSKNNEVSSLATQAEVTGYTPKEWQYSNNPYFNADGTLNSVYTSEAFDNTGGFSTIIDNAKEKLKTTTDATERANLEATIKYATQSKAYKTLNDTTGRYAKYAHEVAGVTPQQTEVARQFDASIDQTNNALGIEADTQKYSTDAQLQNNREQRAADEKALNAEIVANNAAKTEESNAYAQYDMLLRMFDTSETRKRSFITEKIKPIFEGEESAGEQEIIQLILENTEKYNIDKDDARVICGAFGVGTDWLNAYEDRTGDDKYKGMQKKK